MEQSDQDNAERQPEQFLGDDPEAGGEPDELGQGLFGDLEDDEESDTSGQNEGLMVDFSGMTDEQVTAYIAANPGVVQSSFGARAGMQSANTQRSQQVSQRNQELDAREQRLNQQEASLQALIDRASEQSSRQQPQGDGQQSTKSINEARDLGEAMEIILNNVGSVVDEKIGAVQEQSEAERQQAAMLAQIDRGFVELNESYPSTANSTERAKIEKVMADEGIMNPTAAFLHMNRSAIHQRHTAETAQRAKKRKEKPSTKPTKATSTGVGKPKTREEALTAAQAYAKAHPDDFEEIITRVDDE